MSVESLGRLAMTDGRYLWGEAAAGEAYGAAYAHEEAVGAEYARIADADMPEDVREARLAEWREQLQAATAFRKAVADAAYALVCAQHPIPELWPCPEGCECGWGSPCADAYRAEDTAREQRHAAWAEVCEIAHGIAHAARCESASHRYCHC